ncbi:HMG box transcription factor [Ophiocordyceps camponoti-floridani]|uniref:HMG box transcription factor n=1 Tax=Ophiocordyceps camponoti-floridani TaxID=2030778 RepID=A0A8H4VF26_9HYPO|nr:HMG box transcription factor [Ophiocordyceps camponoti-floridani]
MTQVLGLGRQMEAALGGLQPRHHAGSGGLSPSPSGTGSFRKRAATLGDAVDAGRQQHPQQHPQQQHLAQQQHQPHQDGSRELICLCAPEPKIPRPRNAFILYRQHHQAQVTADNPKLSNPDISKIIGDKWKKESEAIKQNWKSLAEEEKQRHQNQYPNYRYQPRRGNKSQAGGWPSTTSPTEEHGRCPKCHGRPMATPQTPSTPFASSPAAKLAMTPQRLDTTPMSRRSSLDHSPTALQPFTSKLPPVRDLEPPESGSPDSKRRRADGAGGYHSVSRYGSASDLPLADGLPPNPILSYARTPNKLPELGSLARSQSGPMPPPPTALRPQSASAPWLVDKDLTSRRHSCFDESLRLPPLQSPLSPSPARSQSIVDARNVGLSSSALALSSPTRDQTVARSSPQTLEDMVMSISFKRKVSLLASICPPAPPLRKGGAGQGETTRGAFIAVEGPDTTLRRRAGNAIEKGLIACGEVQLKVWHDQNRDEQVPETISPTTTATSSTAATMTAHTSPTSSSPPVDADSEAMKQTSPPPVRFGDVFQPYFKTMASWQTRAKQIGRHITGTNDDVDSEEQHADGERVEAPAPADESAVSSTEAIPVALAKEGFSLTIADRYACAMPIPDSYGAAEHWKWMATLWRGTLCPDLIVYVTAGDDGNERRTVELSRSMGLIVVKVPAGKGLDEATERRLAFEVMEWMREGSFREPLPRDWRSHML